MLNPGRHPVELPLPGAADATPLVGRGVRTEAGVVELDGHGYVVLDLGTARVGSAR
ncbi:hypothetical protein [Isoptericola sp. AK164]|uniref:hypothetical protein n=1 Tax=Isoptericola sp. AK164 TaxID=3024246 RepID=UPI00241814BD|nr:hypothetical protein [Isoptericola sp. AK164]